MNEHSETAKPGIHVLAKPIGPVCDIKCDYCFYLEKRALFASDEPYRMPDAVLAAYIEQYVAAQPAVDRTVLPIPLRLYGPLEPWFNKTWRPDDIRRVK